MNAHDDEHIDAALEALARQEPPADHVARVLARSGPQTSDGPGAMGDLRPRWILPAAATVLAVLGVAWQSERRVQVQLDALLVHDTAALAGGDRPPASSPRWGEGTAIDRPVLPPQAYWGMDAFEEWENLRPGSGFRVPGTGTVPGTGDRVPGTEAVSGPGQRAAVLAWVPVPSGLPLIELEPITTTPIDIAPLAALEDITVTDIALAPIVIAPVTDQEKP